MLKQWKIYNTVRISSKSYTVNLSSGCENFKVRSEKCTLAPELTKTPIIGHQIKIAYYIGGQIKKALYMARLIKNEYIRLGRID